MKIEFVNHSSIIYDNSKIRMICDPWIEGPVFQDGWNHLAPSKFNFSDFDKITHIWFSHEHPDHFFPPNIKKIEEKHREKITVLFQETNDKKVRDFLVKLGFKAVIELTKDKWHSIIPGFKIMCNPFGHDSWLCVKTEEKTILNTNDCVIREIYTAQEIKNKIGKVDILLTQFGYGQYEGNRNEPHKRKIAVETKFNQIDTQIKVFKPDYLIPFASFIYFCHEENYYMNDEVNRIGNVYDYYKKAGSVEPVIMYLGNVWDIQTEYIESSKSIEQWNIHYNNLIENPTLIKTKTIPLEKIIEIGNSRIKSLSENKNIVNKFKKIPKLNIFITDLKKSVILSNKELSLSTKTDNQVELSSEVLFYCLKFDWGFNTTHVNGRVQFKDNGYNNFKEWEGLFNNLNHNHQVPNLINRVIDKAKREMKKLLTMYKRH